MNIYLAGPMQGYKEFNFPAFFYYEKLLKDQGYRVFSPATKDIEAHGDAIWKGLKGSLPEAEKLGFSLRRALSDDTSWICREAEAIAMMPGWENSKGAQAEWALARALGLTIIYLEPQPQEKPQDLVTKMEAA